jgi:hypothetical protein
MSSMPKAGSSSMYSPQQTYSNPQVLYRYPESSGLQQSLQYTSIAPSADAVNQQYASYHSFPTPPLQQSRPGSSPESYPQDPYSQHDLADLLGSLDSTHG